MTRSELHQLLDQVPEDTLPRIARFLESIADPVWRAMENAPLDDEPLTDAEEQATQAGLADLAAGRTVSLKSLMTEYGVEIPEL